MTYAAGGRKPDIVSEERLEHLAVMHFNVDFLPSRAEFVDIQRALRELQSLRAEAERLRSQLPDGMENCTIRLETCAVCGRHWLQPANWVNHGCPHCERDTLRALASRKPREGEALTDTYVQQVPDKCDRIIWRGRYYGLPLSPADVPLPPSAGETSSAPRVCPDCNNGGNWTGITWTACARCNGTGRVAASDAKETPL